MSISLLRHQTIIATKHWLERERERESERIKPLFIIFMCSNILKYYGGNHSQSNSLSQQLILQSSLFTMKTKHVPLLSTSHNTKATTYVCMCEKHKIQSMSEKVRR